MRIDLNKTEIRGIIFVKKIEQRRVLLKYPDDFVFSSVDAVVN